MLIFIYFWSGIVFQAITNVLTVLFSLIPSISLCGKVVKITFLNSRISFSDHKTWGKKNTKKYHIKIMKTVLFTRQAESTTAIYA